MIAASALFAEVPPCARRLETELDVWPRDVDATDELSASVTHRVLAYGTGQPARDNQTLDQPLEPTVGKGAVPIWTSKHTPKCGGPARAWSIEAIEGIVDPSLTAASTQRVVEGLLDEIVGRYGTEVAQRAGDGGRRNAVDQP